MRACKVESPPPEGEWLGRGDYRPLPPRWGKAGMGVKCPSNLLRTLGELANQRHRRMIGERFLKSLSPLICLVVGLLSLADRAVSVQINDGSGIQVGHGDSGWRDDHARRARRMCHMQVSVNDLRVRLTSPEPPCLQESASPDDSRLPPKPVAPVSDRQQSLFLSSCSVTPSRLFPLVPALPP